MTRCMISVGFLLTSLIVILHQDIRIDAQLFGTASFKKRITGADLDTAQRWQVAGTDLGIPYVLENGAIGFLFGDTFSTAWPEDGQGWRSPVMLCSHNPINQGVVWDNAARVGGDGFAPALFDKEDVITNIPNDGISFPETGRQLVSFMAVEQWYNGPNLPEGGAMWRSRYAGLAYTDNGNDFTRTDLKWMNNANNNDPYQMWTMQRDGDWVYIYSVRAGRQLGPMMLRRVNWQRLFWPDEYQCWGNTSGTWSWTVGTACTGIINGVIGEPSVRKLSDGTWVMAYLNVLVGSIVTRKSTSPTGPWSSEKIQVTALQESAQYGGFIHPWSTPNNLNLMVSTWKHDQNGKSTAYHVSQWVGTA